MTELEDIVSDPFAARFAEQLFSRYPEWSAFRAEPDLTWQSDGALAVEVPSRFAPLCPLRIDAENEGIIISWVGWHIHCDDWAGDYTEEQFVAEAFDVLDGLLSEKQVVIIDWVVGPGGSGGLCAAENVDEELQHGWWSRVAQQWPMVVISWNGTYDRGPFDPAKC